MCIYWIVRKQATLPRRTGPWSALPITQRITLCIRGKPKNIVARRCPFGRRSWYCNMRPSSCRNRLWFCPLGPLAD